MSVLFAFCPEGFGLPEWYLTKSPNEVDAIPLDELGRVSADRVVWLIPGTDVHLANIEATARSMADLRTMALFQLEDDISQAVSAMHIAIGPKSPANPNLRPAALVSRSDMQSWLLSLDALPEEFASRIEFIPETSLFPGAGIPFIYDGDERFLISDGETAPLAVDPELVVDMVPALIQQAELSEAELFQGSGHRVEMAPLPASFKLGPAIAQSFPQFVSSPLLEGAGINLRQGEFATRSKMSFKVTGWTGSFALAGAAVFLWIAASLTGLLQLNSASDRLYENMVTAYATTFPSEGRVVDPRREVVAKLRNQPGTANGPDFITLTSVFYSGLQNVEGVELENFSFDASTGQLTATLRFSGYQDRDLLKQIFEQQGLPISLGGARQDEGALVGEAILGGAL